MIVVLLVSPVRQRSKGATGFRGATVFIKLVNNHGRDGRASGKLRRGRTVLMDDEAWTPSGLDPAHRREPRTRPPWGRRWPPRHPRPEGGPGHATARPAYAALDLGTNNCRLLVARPAREGFRVIDAFSRIIRLGEGMGASGRLGEAAIERAGGGPSIWRDKMLNRGATRARLIATEACRSAANGRDFCDRVREEVGLDLEIVDRQTEAALAAIGCTPLMDPLAEGVILFDIGGGPSGNVRVGRHAA